MTNVTQLTDPAKEQKPITVTCSSCTRDVPKWVAVLWQHEHDLYGEEIETTSGDAIVTLCGYCADELDTKIRLAVKAVVNPVKAA